MERNVDVAKALINFYNRKSFSSISAYAKGNQEIVFKALEKVDGNIDAIKNHIREWTDKTPQEEYPNDSAKFRACFVEFNPIRVTLTSPENNTVAPAISTPASDLTLSLNIIGRAVADAVKATSIAQIESEIMGSVQDEVRTFIKNEYGTIERKVTTIIDNIPRPGKGFIHEKFDTVLRFVANDEPVFLSGPAGSGKNFLCKQVADALGLKFYFSNAVTQEYKLTGFTDAMGNYQPTQFYKAFTEGGLFMLDEVDASIPEVLVILNAAIANKYFDFPAPIGYKEAHPDFRVVAAGNTTGHGADYSYVGRMQLDGATLDRFALVNVDYSKEIEDGLAADTALADFCRDFRNASKKVGVNIIVSYRAIGRLAKMVKLLSIEEALKTCLIKDLEKDDLHIITKELPDTQYKKALNTLYSQM